jgi:tetratricopeptide (TPR) repeat protein/predicted Ser/Thr protein kinase
VSDIDHGSPPSQIGQRYRVQSELARGGMGVVYEALDTATGRAVAVKALLEAEGPTTALFEQEYRTLAQLQHPRIIEVYDYGIDGDRPYYAMERLPGEDLRRLAPMDFREACRHLRDVAASLALLHARGLLHRDVSPRNIRSTDDGRAKLLDFGALMPFGTTDHVVGTPPCIAPEALQGQPLDGRTDLYSLGAVAYYVLTGRHAYPARRLADLSSMWEQDVPEPSTLRPGIPPALDALVMSMLQEDPLRRPSGAAEVIDRLGAIADLEPDADGEAWESYLTAPELVGRGREVRRLAAHLDRAGRGQPRGVVIEGSAGIGRTRLLDETALQGQLRGATVVRVRAELHTTSYGVAKEVGRRLFAALPETARRTATPHAHTLGQLLPELAELADGPLPPPSEDPAEQRARTQDALASWILAIAAEHPLVLCVDDVHVADDNSLAMLATLPFAAHDERILVLTSARDGVSPRAPEALAALKEASHRLRVRGLETRHTEQLVRTLFGDTSHGMRLAHWLQERTDGRPLHIIELVRHLVRRDIIRFVEGNWTLPQAIPEESLPGSLEDALATRLDELGPGALKLAKTMSIEAGTFGLDRAAAATGDHDVAAVRPLADELVRLGVWTRADEAFRFRQEPLRQRLLARLGATTRRAIHRRIGDWRMEDLDFDSEPMDLVDAGQHLLQAGDEDRGADLLAWASTKLWKRVEGVEAAAAAAEMALEVYDRKNRPARNRMPLLTILAIAGWYVDWRLSAKYGDRAVELGADLTGMKLARRLGPRIGVKLALVVGIVVGLVGHLFHRHQVMSARRSFQEMMTNFFSAAATRIGVAAICFDTHTVERTLEHLQPLQAFGPKHPGGLMYRFYRQMLLSIRGDESAALATGENLLELMSDQQHWLRHLDDDVYRGIHAGVLLGLGMLNNTRDVGAGLEYARKLEDLDLAFYKGAVAQIRLMHHATRGELEEVAQLRHEVDALAVKGGAVWQSEITVTVSMNKAYQQTGDLMGLKQTMQQLERWASNLPSLQPYLLCCQAAYALEKGDPDTAIARYEEAFEDLVPGGSVGWADSRGNYARAWLAKGEPERAKQVCLEAMAHFRPENLDFVQHYLEVQRVLALAEAELGDLTDAAECLEQLLARHGDCGPVTVANLHQARARVALLAKERGAFDMHLGRMEATVRPTRNSAMLRQVEQLAADGSRAFGVDHIPRVGKDHEHVTTRVRSGQVDTSQLRSLLDRCVTVEERAQTALHALLDHTGAVRGYLYGHHAGRLHLMAQTDPSDPPADLPRRVDRAIDTFLDEEMEETTSGDARGIPDSADTDAMVMVVILHTARDGRPIVVGAAALEPSPDQATDAVPLDMVDVVARSFFESGELSGVERAAS